MRYLIGLLTAMVGTLALAAVFLNAPLFARSCTRQYRDQAPVTMRSAVDGAYSPSTDWPSERDVIPIYPGPVITDTEFSRKTSSVETLLYYVDPHIEQVKHFYGTQLPKLGWVPLESIDDIASRGQGPVNVRYRWRDPTQQAPWVINLTVVIDRHYSQTSVQLDSSRNIDPNLSLPVYSEAGAEPRDVRVNCAEEPTGPGELVTRTRITTFVTDATAEQLTDFYNGEMLARGWKFWSEDAVDLYTANPGYVETQPGDIRSQEGLVFGAGATNEKSTYAVNIFRAYVTAKPDGDKQLLVEVKLVEEQESIDFKL